MEFLRLKVKLGHGVFEESDYIKKIRRIWDNNSNGRK